MIPKIIHYCWFGGKEKPAEVLKYIETWKQILPEYKIMEWNESNFSVDYCKYTREAYDNKKYAFVADVARLYSLYEYGGIYFDTDIEVLKPFNNYLDAPMVVSFESESLLMTGFFASEEHNEVIRKLLKEYNGRRFINADGTMNTVANTVYLTQLLRDDCGLVPDGTEQTLDNGIKVYAYKTFGAFDADNSYFDIGEETVLVHRCMGSWCKETDKIKLKMKMTLARILGKDRYNIIRKKIKGK